MKFSQILCAAAISLATVPAMSQDVVIYDFEAGIPSWTSTSGFVHPTTHLTDGGGKNISGSDTLGYMRLRDNGWGAGWTVNNAATPAAGKYRLELYYRNGVTDVAMKALTIGLVQDGSSKVSLSIPAAAQTAWTLAQSGVIDLTGSPLNLVIANQQSASEDNSADLDEIRLIAISGNAPLELSVFPTPNIHLSLTETIKATPTFGSETYTQVEFDVNNDGTAELVDTTAPFEFTWDTLVHVAAGTSRTLSADPPNTPVAVKITVTDSDNQSVSIINNYTVDNRFDGRQSIIVNGDFSAWQAPDGAGNRLPVGWVEQSTTETTPVYGPAPSYSPAAGDALRIAMTAAPGGADPFPQRYALRTVGVKGSWRNLQTHFWGLGDYCRLYYMISTDGGVTYRTTQQSAGEANSGTWKFAVQSTPKNIGLVDSSFVALGTHQLNTTENLWDDVVSEGIKLPETSSVGGWKLY